MSGKTSFETTAQLILNSPIVLGSTDQIKSIFNSLNESLFSGNLSDITVEWIDKLKACTAITMEKQLNISDRKTIIYLNKTLLGKCTRKQILGSLLYEMIYAYIVNKTTGVVNNDNKEKLLQALLRRAMNFVNSTGLLNLFYNYPLRIHQTTDSNAEWIDIGDGDAIHKFNDSIICISDDESDADESNNISGDNNNNSKIISQRIHLQDIEHEPYVGCCCCTDFDTVFKQYFVGTNFRLCSEQK